MDYKRSNPYLPLLGSVLIFFFISSFPAFPQTHPLIANCFDPHTIGVFDGPGQRTILTSGQLRLDTQICDELGVLRQAFSLNPSFSFYEDSGGPNALALPQGLVLLGLNLMKAEFESEWVGEYGNYSVIGILAHEFGHILQFKNGLHRQFPTKLMELHADFLAGWYMGNRGMIYPTDVSQAMRALYRKGDYAFNSPSHHGTPSERLRAFIAGTQALRLNYHQAFLLGRNYIISNFMAPGLSTIGKQGLFGCALVGDPTLPSPNPKSNKKIDLNIKDIDNFLTEPGSSFSNPEPQKPSNQKMDIKNIDDFLTK